MHGAYAIIMSSVLVLALTASLPVMAGMFEACRAAQSEVGNVTQCVQTVCKTVQAELAPAELTRRTALHARIAANKGMDRGAAMAFDRTVCAHQLYRQAECDLSRRLIRNTPDVNLAEATCEADLSREHIGALRGVAQPATPAAAPVAPN